MTKKTYCPMTVEYEELLMNQAIAGGCEYMPATENGKKIVCNQCKTNVHYWYAFDNDLPVEPLESDVLYVSASDPVDAQCKIVLKATPGMGFFGSASGQISNGYLEEPLVNTTMTPYGYVDISSMGALGFLGTSTIGIIHNS